MKMIKGRKYKINNVSVGTYLGTTRGSSGKQMYKFKMSRSIEKLNKTNDFVLLKKGRNW
jgi:hypothetical protein